MVYYCEVMFKPSATPAQLKAVGRALWAWCRRAAGPSDGYALLNHQGLADLLAGRFPTPGRSGRRGLCLAVEGEVPHDREAAIEALRDAIPADGVQDLRVDGVSWDHAGTSGSVVRVSAEVMRTRSGSGFGRAGACPAGDEPGPASH